jgi:hypothetical protein
MLNSPADYWILFLIIFALLVTGRALTSQDVTEDEDGDDDEP